MKMLMGLSQIANGCKRIKKTIADVTVFFRVSPSDSALVSAILSASVLRRKALVRD